MKIENKNMQHGNARMERKKMKIVIVDDDRIVTESLRMIVETDPEFAVAAVGYGGEEAVRLYRRERPDVLLLDIRMPDGNGLEAAREILAEFPEARILFLTTFTDDEYIIEALRLGVCGYLLKQDYKSLVPSLKAVASGQAVFGGTITEKLPALIRRGADKEPEDFGLSEREYEMICLVAEGLSNREIAEKMFLSEGTVRNYLSVILEKLSLRDRTQLACFYYQKLNREN